MLNNAAPNATLNTIDLLSNFRSHGGISINLPEFSVWRVRLRITIIINTVGAIASNDGSLETVFVESVNQTAGNAITLPYEQSHMLYDFHPLAESSEFTGIAAAGNYVLTREYDLKSHRKLRALDDTLYLQLAASGQATYVNYSICHATLLRMKR